MYAMERHCIARERDQTILLQLAWKHLLWGEKLLALT
jgi:hypothetical protein